LQTNFTYSNIKINNLFQLQYYSNYEKKISSNNYISILNKFFINTRAYTTDQSQPVNIPQLKPAEVTASDGVIEMSNDMKELIALIGISTPPMPALETLIESDKLDKDFNSSHLKQYKVYIKISGIPITARRKDVTDLLTGIQYDRLLCLYTIGGKQTESWYLILESFEEFQKLRTSNLTISNKKISIVRISKNFFMENTRLHLSSGRSILISNLDHSVDEITLIRFFVTFNPIEVSLLKSRNAAPCGKALMVMQSPEEAHRAMLEIHGQKLQFRPIEIAIIN